MQNRAVPPPDRAGAVSDAFSLAAAGRLGTAVALDLASKLRDDPDNLVRQTVVSCLVDLVSLYSEVCDDRGVGLGLAWGWVGLGWVGLGWDGLGWVG